MVTPIIYGSVGATVALIADHLVAKYLAKRVAQIKAAVVAVERRTSHR